MKTCKRLTALMLTVLLLAGILAGCSSSTAAPSTTPAETEVQSEASASESVPVEEPSESPSETPSAEAPAETPAEEEAPAEEPVLDAASLPEIELPLTDTPVSFTYWCQKPGGAVSSVAPNGYFDYPHWQRAAELTGVSLDFIQVEFMVANARGVKGQTQKKPISCGFPGFWSLFCCLGLPDGIRDKLNQEAHSVC